MSVGGWRPPSALPGISPTGGEITSGSTFARFSNSLDAGHSDKLRIGEDGAPS
jgi:hypothetical protein